MLQYQPCPTENRQGRRSGRKCGTTLALAAYPVCGFVDEPDEDLCGPRDAHVIRAPAHDSFSEGFATTDLQKAKTLPDELRACGCRRSAPNRGE